MPIFTGVKQNEHIECAIIKISYDYANQRNSFRGIFKVDLKRRPSDDNMG